MKTAIASLPLLLSVACGDAREARVELDLRSEPCTIGECTVHLLGEGLIYTAGTENEQGIAGEDTLYAEIFTSSGALALIEIGIEGGRARQVRYREIADGQVVFSARVEQEQISVLGDGNWTFAFEGHDPLGAEQAEPVRVISNGRVLLYENGAADPIGSVPSDPIDPVPPPAEPKPDAGTTRPPPPTTPRPRPDDDDDDDYDADVYVDTSGCDDVEVESSGGCDSGGDSGCEGGDSSGCEGDTSGGGCEGGDSSCEGDVAGSAGDCDSCSGDVAAIVPPDVQRKRAILGMLRLSWPLWLAGWFNRRKRRSERGLVGEASLGARALGARGRDDHHGTGEVVVEGAGAAIDDQP